MLKLSLPTEPYWLDVGFDVRIKVRPCTSAIFYQARAFMNQKLQSLGEAYRAQKDVGVAQSDLPNLEESNVREALAEQYLTLGLARAGIIEWEGICEADSDVPASVTSQKIEELFAAYWVIAETFRQQYTGLREMLESEKTPTGSYPMALWGRAKILQQLL
ncbi:hypothetical protein [Bartonella rattaustraliani]|uniref:hypothetical protein n=1 Tax=Bartonella rattaustraliani TaxID=481139 RepID=UPI0002F8F6DA|nr:hypothetical protein [Bartonella rattaustraliani]